MRRVPIINNRQFKLEKITWNRERNYYVDLRPVHTSRFKRAPLHSYEMAVFVLISFSSPSILLQTTARVFYGLILYMNRIDWTWSRLRLYDMIFIHFSTSTLDVSIS